MNRRSRKRKRGEGKPSPEAYAAAELIMATYTCFSMSCDERVITFSVTGKKFWTQDTSSLRAFVHGSQYNRMCVAKAKVPDAIMLAGPRADTPHTWVRVPATVADRIPVIATALHNQVALSVTCNFPFTTLAMAAHCVRNAIAPPVFMALKAQALAANQAKHMACNTGGAPPRMSLIVDDDAGYEGGCHLPGGADILSAVPKERRQPWQDAMGELGMAGRQATPPNAMGELGMTGRQATHEEDCGGSSQPLHDAMGVSDNAGRQATPVEDRGGTQMSPHTLPSPYPEGPLDEEMEVQAPVTPMVRARCQEAETPPRPTERPVVHSPSDEAKQQDIPAEAAARTNDLESINVLGSRGQFDRCDENHLMSIKGVDELDYQCDLCDDDLDGDEPQMYCAVCDYSVCSACTAWTLGVDTIPRGSSQSSDDAGFAFLEQAVKRAAAVGATTQPAGADRHAVLDEEPRSMAEEPPVRAELTVDEIREMFTIDPNSVTVEERDRWVNSILDEMGDI